ncbi:DUF596 domain-containing protein [Agromyces larvae]|uniref:DUF596 domain-containing protein n=1 Tax=Agromyces larvae TaxID=2929802 RepID=A0ABY4BVH9_9MICO|nr:DUF596 domain-containing protein [Agromyces larvae]UOE42909.1 DUF596 domain-containing protein [Agromyces larvae]
MTNNSGRFQHPTAFQLQYIAEYSEMDDLNGLWRWFASREPNPAVPQATDDFATLPFAVRREAFFWTLEQLIDHRYIRLEYWEWWPHGSGPVDGGPSAQVDVLRREFPTDDIGLDDGIWFFTPPCPVGSNWYWPDKAEPLRFIAEPLPED